MSEAADIPQKSLIDRWSSVSLARRITIAAAVWGLFVLIGGALALICLAALLAYPRLERAYAIAIGDRDRATLDQWITHIKDIGHVAVDTETTSLDEMRAELVGISLCVDAGKAAYIPLGHKQGGGDLFGSSELIEGQLDLKETLAALKPVLEDPSILKIGQNMKYD